MGIQAAASDYFKRLKLAEMRKGNQSGRGPWKLSQSPFDGKGKGARTSTPFSTEVHRLDVGV